MADEIASFEGEDRKFFRPAIRAIANFRDLAERCADAIIKLKSVTLIDDGLRKASSISLKITMAAIFEHVDAPMGYLLNADIDKRKSRLLAIRRVRRSMREVGTLCGGRLLEAGDGILSKAHEVADHHNLAIEPPPIELRDDVLRALREKIAMNPTWKRETIIKMCGKRRHDANKAMNYLEKIGEFVGH